MYFCLFFCEHFLNSSNLQVLNNVIIDLTQLFAILGLLTNVVLMTGANFLSQNNLDLFDIGLTVKKRSRHKSTTAIIPGKIHDLYGSS